MEILLHATTWTTLEDIILNEISQSPKKKKRLHLYRVSEVVRLIEIERRIVVARNYGEGEMGSCRFVGVEFQLFRTGAGVSGDLLHNSVQVVDSIVL